MDNALNRQLRAAKIDPAKIKPYDFWRLIIAGMMRLGASPAVASYIASQSAFETGQFNSKAAIQQNNYSGIKWPARYKRSGYRSYASILDWANDMKRILNFNKGAGKPWDATSLPEYLQRLAVNGYYTPADNAGNKYVKGVQYYQDKFSNYKDPTPLSNINLTDLALMLIPGALPAVMIKKGIEDSRQVKKNKETYEKAKGENYRAPDLQDYGHKRNWWDRQNFLTKALIIAGGAFILGNKR